MARSETEQIIGQLRKVIERRKKIVFFFLALLVGAAALYNWRVDPVYRASTTLAFDEFVGATATFNSDRTQEIRTSNRIQELSSRSFAEEVAQSLSEEDLARFPAPQEVELGWTPVLSATKAIDDALLAAPVRKSSLIELVVELHDPILSAKVANAAAEVYQERNLRIKQEGVRGIRKFVEEQLDRFGIQLEESEDALRTYKERNKIGSFDDEKKEVLHRLTEAEVLYNAATTDRYTLETRLTAVEESLLRTRAQIVPSVTEVVSPRLVRLQEKLVDLQLQYTDLQVQNYPPTHPKMMELGRAIQETESSLREEAESVAAGGGGGDPLAQLDKYGNERLDLQIELQTVEARIEALASVIRGYEATLGRLPDQEMQLVRLTRDRDVSQKVYGNLLEKLEDTKISEAENIPSVRIIDKAIPNPNPELPRKRVNLAIGAMLGLILGFGAAFAREAAVGSVDSLNDLEEMTGWSSLASVPHVARLPKGDIARNGTENVGDSRALKRHLIASLDPQGAAAEAFRILRTNMELRGVGDRLHTVLVTSSKPNDGKTSIVSNLALAFAAAGRRVLVVDAEVRRPSMHWIFDVPAKPGIVELLATDVVRATPARETSGKGGEQKAARDAELVASAVGASIHASPTPNISVMPVGIPTEATGELIASHLDGVRAILANVAKDFDLVLLDTPPLTIVHDTAVLANLVDGALFVVNSRRPDSELLAQSQTTLERSGVEVIGTVLNQVTPVGVYRSNDYYVDRS